MKYIKKINEYRNQLIIPFNGKNPLHDKPTHFHIVDALEELSKESKEKPEEYFSNNYNIEKHCQKSYE
jgi:hypothetical protein